MNAEIDKKKNNVPNNLIIGNYVVIILGILLIFGGLLGIIGCVVAYGLSFLVGMIILAIIWLILETKTYIQNFIKYNIKSLKK
jgi:Na+-driven multidrug efflux pump